LRPGDMINNCVITILDNGKFDGDIYVVSCDQSVSEVTELGSNVKFVNTNTARLQSPDTNIYMGYKSFDEKYDIMIYAHSDVAFNYRSDNWWGKLKEAWGYVDINKVWGIGIPVYAGQPDDLYQDGEALICPVNNYHHFGLGSDLYNPLHPTKWSPVHSWTTNFYYEVITKYGWNTGLALEHLMFYEGVQKRKWSLIARNGGFINHQYHEMGIDTRFVTLFFRYCKMSYDVFYEHHGISLDHFVGAWFGLTLNLHKEEILNAIHIGDYDSIDYIFDEASEIINNPDCNKCVTLNPDMKGCRALDNATTAHTTY